MQPHTASDICAITAPASPIRAMQRGVAAHFEISTAAMLSANRAHHIARPRHVAMWIARREHHATLHQIGRMFNRNHSSVTYAMRRIDGLMAARPAFAAEVLTLRLLCIAGAAKLS
jgi:chromosomal replication initiator protein